MDSSTNQNIKVTTEPTIREVYEALLGLAPHLENIVHQLENINWRMTILEKYMGLDENKYERPN